MKKMISEFLRVVGMGTKLVWPFIRISVVPRLRVFWRKGGYYISLFALLGVIGIASYTIRARVNTPVVPMPTASPAPTAEAQPASVIVAPQFALMLPVEGEIIGEYVVDELVWSDVLQQWQTHPGVDIAAPLGTAVYAAENGTIKSAYKDALLGNTIVLTHADGYETVYSCLGTLSMVENGQEVEKGEIIASVGNTGIAEEAAGAHLHFEVWKDGESVSPAEILSA